MSSSLENNIRSRLQNAVARRRLADADFEWLSRIASSVEVSRDYDSRKLVDRILASLYLWDDGGISYDEMWDELAELIPLSQSVSFGSLHLSDSNVVESEPRSGASGTVVYSRATLPMREELRPIASDWSTDLLYRVTQGLNRAARLPVLRPSG